MKKISLGILAVAIVAFLSIINVNTLMNSLDASNDVALESLLSEASAYPEEGRWNDSDVYSGVEWFWAEGCENGVYYQYTTMRMNYMCISGGSVYCALHPQEWSEDTSWQDVIGMC
jgi:hypothetical protein